MAITRDELLVKLANTIQDALDFSPEGADLEFVPWHLQDNSVKACAAAMKIYLEVISPMLKDMAEETRHCHHGTPLPEGYLKRL